MSGGAEADPGAMSSDVAGAGEQVQRYELDNAVLRRLLLRPELRDLPAAVLREIIMDPGRDNRQTQSSVDIGYLMSGDAGADPGAMSRGTAGAGVQVVRMGTGAQRYELDDVALRRLLLRPEVRDLPAVVLSVAGAYRGGKSFILDFFLRYLKASLSSQRSGEWLGNEDDQLKGFHWRGGAERDTTGIHLWPEPIIATLDTGEKVAVLLMDTQGTFDSESTIGQNSTIFALSTLISSVQVYNLFGNIREDDLQHLQLFTEYGKLACEGKAFQKLLFLVRDWVIPYEHTYGFEGGAALLSKRLRSSPNQNAELREVREHINSSFDQIKCFLMPHPGLCVSKENFAGCIRDLTEEFRLQLLELVPTLFRPEHLTPKVINGERVRTQDLFEYFQKYVDIFNSDEVPGAVTIFKATADACLLAATRAARSLYDARMEEHVRGARSLASSALTAAHANARAAAEHCFTQKKKMGSQQDADARLQELIKELDGSLSKYILENEAKAREMISLAKKTYDAAVSSVCGDHARLCLHPGELEDLHAEASMAAFELFDAARDVPEDDEDDQRPDLEQSLKQKYEYLRAINDQNNKSAVLAARELYETRMKSGMDQAGVSSNKLQAQHQAAQDDAIASLAHQRNRSTEHDDDPFVQQLLQELDGILSKYKLENEAKVRETISLAKKTYDAAVNSVCGDQARLCLHPGELEDVHAEASMAALALFDAARNVREDEEDDQRPDLEQSLKQKYEYLRAINDQNNKSAVLVARELYETRMKSGMDQAGVSSNKLQEQHQAAQDDAIASLANQRNRFTEHNDDPFVQQLLQELDGILSKYILENEAKVRETMSLAKKTYDAAVSSVCGDHAHLCLHPGELKDVHAEASMAALELFDAARNVPEDEEDDQRPDLEQSLKQKYEYLRAINDQNNKSAVLAARELYEARMKTGMDQAGVSSDKLQAQHQAAQDDAVASLVNQRNRSTEHNDDPFVQQLLQELEGSLSKYILKNEANVREMMSRAKNTYDAAVSSVCGDHASLCLHPEAFEDLHAEASKAALELFDAARNVPEDEEDDQRPDLEQSLKQKYEYLRAINDQNNKSAVLAARELYETLMKSEKDQAGVSIHKLQAQHQAVQVHAVASLAHQRNRSTKHNDDPFEQQLLQELDGSLSKYILENEAEVLEMLSLAKETYDTAVSSVCGDHARLCLHPETLEDLHAEASMAALALFDAARNVPEDEEDDQRLDLEASLEQKYEYLRAINDQNNKSAVLAARELYETRMKSGMDQAGVSSDKLQAQHQAAQDDAVASLTHQRNRSTEHNDDPFMQQLLQEIETCFEKFEKSNKNKKKIAMQAAEHKYNNFITSTWGPQTCCYHTRALADLHKQAVEATLEHCLADRHVDEDDEYKREMTETLEKRLPELISVNEYNNERAVEQAVWVYNMEIVKNRPIRFFSQLIQWRPKEAKHLECKRDAVKVFQTRRRGTKYPNDKHFDNLIKKIDEAYENNIFDQTEPSPPPEPQGGCTVA